jgi:hypothetical protein
LHAVFLFPNFSLFLTRPSPSPHFNAIPNTQKQCKQTKLSIQVINPVNGLPASQSDPSIASTSGARGRDVIDFAGVVRSRSMHSELYGANPQQQLYEIDSEEEDRFLRFERDTSRPPSRNEDNNFELPQQTGAQMDVIREDENETPPSDAEDGAAKTRMAPKPKTRRARATTAAKPKPATAAAPRARRKLRKDTDMEVEVC